MAFHPATDGESAVRHMARRASCRSFQDKPIPQDVLDLLLDAAMQAASGGNLQPWSVIVERDPQRNRALCDINGGQPFIAQAPVNLIFLWDWHRYDIYTRQKRAPFTCYKSYMHYLIAIEDIMCAAQSVETAAHLMGLGSCYVGSPNHEGLAMRDMYDLPDKTYPVLILSLGYPKNELHTMPKLDRSVMVFESRYPALTDEQIFAAYEQKYAGRTLPLPKNEAARAEMLASFRRALETTYSPGEVDEIVACAEQDGFVNETQRRFGLHYHAADMYALGGEIVEMMGQQGLFPFDAYEKKRGEKKI